MDEDLDLRNFDNVCRLFPLPRVVMLPHSILPLHVFEPRYRQMTEDALAGDTLVTMVQLRTGAGGASRPLGSPPVEAVGCLGRIIQYERLPDGRFNFLLLGRKRVRLTRELPAQKLYRLAEAELIEDVEADEPDDACRATLVGLFRRAFERRQALDPDLAAVLETAMPLGVLTDIVAHALGLPAEVKQLLLDEPRVERRTETLLAILRQVLGRDADRPVGVPPFPPPFSRN